MPFGETMRKLSERSQAHLPVCVQGLGAGQLTLHTGLTLVSLFVEDLGQLLRENAAVRPCE